MKKRGLVVLVSLVALILLTTFGIYFWPVNVGTFSVSDYKEEIDWYLKSVEYWDVHPDTYETSPIKNGRDAKWTAVKLWFNIYGWEIFTEMPYNVFYDEASDTWHVNGSLPKGWQGGTAFLIITSEGEIVAIGHGE